MAERLTAQDLKKRLALRFERPEWLMMYEVANATGGNTRRFADAVGISTFPSRGLEINGFEIKVSRSDWLSELKNPEKAESVARYCHKWWLVVSDREIVQEGELPPNWGLLAAQGTGLRAWVKPKPLEPKPLDMRFLAALCRRLMDEQKALESNYVHRDFIEQEVAARMAEKDNWTDYRREQREQELERMREDVQALYKAIGIDAYYGRQEQLRKAAPVVRLFLSRGNPVKEMRGSMFRMARDAKELLEWAEKIGTALDSLKDPDDNPA